MNARPENLRRKRGRRTYEKLRRISLIMAGLVLIGGFFTFTQAQSSGIDAKPTVISPTPGVYVNGWPPFTVSYPKDWAEQRVQGPGEVFRAAALRPPLPPSPTLAVVTFGNSADISGAANMLAGIFGSIGSQDVKVLYDKPSKLQDGTPAQEAEIEFVPPNAPKQTASCSLRRKMAHG